MDGQNFNMKDTEDKIQQDIFMYLHNNFCIGDKINVVFAVPNQNQYKLTKIGVVAGVSDLIYVTKDKVYFIEIKTENGKQSEKQKIFENKIKSLGYIYLIVRSLDDIKKIF